MIETTLRNANDVALALAGLELAAPDSLKRCETLLAKLNEGNIDEWRGHFILATHDLVDLELLRQLSEVRNPDALMRVILLILVRSVRRGKESLPYKRALLRIDELLQMELLHYDALTLSVLIERSEAERRAPLQA